MRRILFLTLAAALAGCSGDPKPPPMAGTPESTRLALESFLEGWKSGKTVKDFAAQSPPLLVTDDDLNRGTKLLDYAIEGEGKPRGTGYSFVVSMTLQDKAGSKTPAKKKIAYRAYTEPN